jgi:hypothetical protein
VPFLVRDRQRDEPDQVDDEDEEHQRGDVWEPQPDSLRGEALLRDLGLRDLVDELAQRLASAAGLPAHEHEPEQDGQDRAQHQVRDGLVDGEIERAQVDRDPRVLLELLLRMELALGERVAGKRERQQRGGGEDAPHLPPPK